MSKQEDAKRREPKVSLSLDTWAVVLAFVLAFLIKIGVIHRVAW
jgi:hypothetical protein